jgi:hypothetical protein
LQLWHSDWPSDLLISIKMLVIWPIKQQYLFGWPGINGMNGLPLIQQASAQAFCNM